MEVVLYFENEYCKIECFIDGTELNNYLGINKDNIKDYEILEVN